MEELAKTITEEFTNYLRSLIITRKTVFESKVCRTENLSGEILFESGNKYRGDVTECPEMNGKGRYDWTDGDYYQGEFILNSICGKGLMVYANCSKVSGTFMNGVPHGECKFVGKNVKYVGDYQFGRKNGNGKFYETNGYKDNLIYDGTWLDGDKAEGTRYYSNGTFTGNFVNNSRNYGTYKFNDSSIYTGEFVNSKFHGHGVCSWSEHNTSYKGHWCYNKKHGFGVLQINDLVVLTMWRDDMKSGAGLIKCSNGDILISPKMFKEDIIENANLIAVYSIEELIKLLNNPSESSMMDFINSHMEAAVNFNLVELSPYLICDSFINLHHMEFIVNFLKKQYENDLRLNKFPDILNYEIHNLRLIITKLLNSFLRPFYERHELNVQINLWNFIIKINTSKIHTFSLLDGANVHLNALVKNVNDASEFIGFNQFLRILIFLSITMYADVVVCRNKFIGYLAWYFLRIVRDLINMDGGGGESLLVPVNLEQFEALDNEIQFAECNGLQLRDFVACARKKRSLLRWREQELFEAIEAIVPPFYRYNFIIDFHIPIVPLEFYLIFLKLTEIVLSRRLQAVQDSKQ